MDTTESRKVSTKVPLTQVPYIMRALGFYPTEQEVGELSTTFFSLLLNTLQKLVYITRLGHSHIIVLFFQTYL